MKRPSYVLRLVAGLAIVVSMFAALSTTAVASPNPSGGAQAEWDHTTWPSLFGATESDVANGAFACVSNIASGKDQYVLGGPECDGAQEVYFASVASGESDFPLGTYQTSVTVQNLEQNDAYVFIYTGNGNGWDKAAVAYLSGGASKTFTASDLGITGGPVPVVAALYQYLSKDISCTANAAGTYTCTLSVGGTVLATFISPTNVTAAVGVGSFAAGVAKTAVGADNLPYTTTATTSVSGYNAVSGREVGFFDQLYFPIVQTNCGPGGCWNTLLRISNVGQDTNAAVTVQFFPSDNAEGSLQTGFQLQSLLNPGATWTIDLSAWVPEGWVGSAHVYTDAAVVAVADRIKVGTNMWITNSASNAAAENYWQVPGLAGGFPYALFAPDVRMDYNGWNTGINVANTVDSDNNVNIQFFGTNGNAGQGLTQRLAAHGMTYFYEPSNPSEDSCQQPAGQVPTCDFVGAAIILSDYPVAAAVDGVKYFGNDNNVGQAFTYSATGNVFNEQAMPLVQKGNPATGMGPTSGINFLNPNADSTLVYVNWLNPSGFQADNFGADTVFVPGFSTGFVYTMFEHNLPNGYYGSALVDSDLPIAATSANVDYQVQYDGTVVWNLYNPCGFFRQEGDCHYTPTPPPPGATGQIIKTVVDTAGNVVAGATIKVTGTTDNGSSYSSTLTTNAAGQASFVVPTGTYDLTITGVPTGWTIDPNTATDSGITITAGQNYEVTNTVQVAMATKIIDTAKPGALICVFGPGGTAQDPKAPPVAGPCYPFGVVTKGSNGGQGVPTSYATALGNLGTAQVTLDSSTNAITASVDLGGLAQGTQVAAAIFGGNGNTVCPTNGNISDLGNNLFPIGSTTASGDMSDQLNISATLSNAQLQALGSLTSDVVAAYDPATGTILGCGQLEQGTVSPATTDQIAAAFGAAAVQIANAQGDATFTLPAGCYVAVTYVPNHMAATENFCLTAGETETNTVEIEPVVSGTSFGYLHKAFVGTDGTPISDFLNISVLDQNGKLFAYVGQTDPDGTIFLSLPVGTYQLCWQDVANPQVGDPGAEGFLTPGCEPITITADTVTEMTNTVPTFAVLDVCVFDEEATTPIAGADVLVIDHATGQVVARGTTDANGVYSILAMPGNYDITANADFYLASSGSVSLPAEAPQSTSPCDLSLGLAPVSAGGTVNKTVTMGGTAVEGASVAVFDGACPATVSGNDFYFSSEDWGFTDATGAVTLNTVASGGNICVVVVGAGVNGPDFTDAPLQILSSDSTFLAIDGTVDLTNEIGTTAGVLDVASIFSVLGFDTPADSDVYVFTATANDTAEGATFAGGCQGTLVASDMTGISTPTGIAQFILNAGDYCVSANPDGDFVYSSVNTTLAAGDPAGNTNALVRESFP